MKAPFPCGEGVFHFWIWYGLLSLKIDAEAILNDKYTILRKKFLKFQKFLLTNHYNLTIITNNIRRILH